MCCIADKFTSIRIDDTGREPWRLTFVLELFLLLPPLLPHDNTEPSILLPGNIPGEFETDTPYSFDSTSGPSTTSVSFSHCPFVGSNYPSMARALSFINYPGSISVLSCSFTSIVSTSTSGAAVNVESSGTPHTNTVRIELSNMTDCSASRDGGGLYLSSPAIITVGPCLTQKVETSIDFGLWRIDLRVEGKIPLESQDYEVTVKENGGGIELTGTLQFRDGVGSLVPSSKMDLKFSKTYTITKIVGVVPASSSESNAITFPLAAWAFNLAATPSLLSFTTPAQPPTLFASLAHLTDPSQPFAYIILVFDQEVSGSYDVVVEERGKDETITVVVNGSSIEGESENIRVVGDDRVLTHDTTYTIKSIARPKETRQQHQSG
ncbi:hypothetical protein BLNAU_11839 [Blattamonas nauphoetae]|uniref:Uncharacterized protein n=1 Tax=Blattamonas nauphoetae TaxID=2049346 RepID=A0ABQ9XQT1_9EUKA|nr:hypothetical protein BLNAU_11839 [Blattamonas nauphoetae]